MLACLDKRWWSVLLTPLVFIISKFSGMDSFIVLLQRPMGFHIAHSRQLAFLPPLDRPRCLNGFS